MKIEQLSEDDMLNDFYNIHLREVISARINKGIYEEIIKQKGEKEVIGEREVIVGQDQSGRAMKSLVKIKAIDALLEETNRLEKQQRILENIKKLKNG